ncbi:hypothetical protein [Tateyamaria sp. ANG-S1]|uniref:hypothetical protein n=1 Tax=Tateyamaria sp. ANG-S1 TaxID=1577905 RepID=UPI00057E1951|nr:hypothetical protein [Tateyamaria sp. ANG-S1]KIC51744.1 hypothetical protein RA29_00025 [Tateyamaria sp. ANG-S1]
MKTRPAPNVSYEDLNRLIDASPDMAQKVEVTQTLLYETVAHICDIADDELDIIESEFFDAILPFVAEKGWVSYHEVQKPSMTFLAILVGRDSILSPGPDGVDVQVKLADTFRVCRKLALDIDQMVEEAIKDGRAKHQNDTNNEA